MQEAPHTRLGLMRRGHAHERVHLHVEVYVRVGAHATAPDAVHVANLASWALQRRYDGLDRGHGASRARARVHELLHRCPANVHAGLDDHRRDQEAPQRVQQRQAKEGATDTA